MPGEDSISGVLEGGPDREALIFQAEVAQVVNGGRGYATAGGAGLPDGEAGTVHKAEVAGVEELEGTASVNRGAITGRPERDAAVGDGGGE